MANDRHTMFFMGKEYPNVAMGGGSGGGMSATELYTATEFASVIELSDNITNYDFIALHAETSAGGLLWEKSELYYVPSLANGDRIGFADDGSYSWYSITDSDTITFELSGGNRYYIKSVVGLKSSSGGGGGSSSGINYSTEEQRIGTWIDGKPLYQRTFDLGSPTQIVTGQWNSVNIDMSTMAKIINCEAVGEDGTCWQTISARTVSNGGLFNNRGSDVWIRYVTLRYTKTTD